MRLRYTRPALADPAVILDYIAAHSPQGATRVHARVETVINLLLSHPHAGVQTAASVRCHILTSSSTK